jgi:hypothetical protein
MTSEKRSPNDDKKSPENTSQAAQNPDLCN